MFFKHLIALSYCTHITFVLCGTEAEDLLTEGNALNNRKPEVWGYLSLIYLLVSKYTIITYDSAVYTAALF